MSQKGLAPIYLVLLIAVIIAVLVYFIFSQGFLNLPIGKKEAQQQPSSFNVKTEYQNPFRESTQDVEYINPFNNLK